VSGKDSPPKYATSQPNGALRQGEILTSIIQLLPSVMEFESLGLLETTRQDTVALKATPYIHPYVIVVSQDCDLDWDFKARQPNPDKDPKAKNKLVPNVLFCMATEAKELRDRDKDLPHGTSKDINATTWNRIQSNSDIRYHFLEKIPKSYDLLGQGLPELAVDFKRYFTVPTDEVYRQLGGVAKRRCKLISPYLEHFALRFYYFQYRVALPEDHLSE